MPPKKAAVEKSDDPIGLILSYLAAQNRPYSSTDISTNLLNKVTKTKCDKILKELAEKQEIEVNDKGKTSVYWAKQDPADSATPEELAVLSTSIDNLRELLPSLKAEAKTKQAALNAILNAPTTSMLRGNLAALTEKKEAMEKRLKVLEKGDVKPISQEEKTKADLEFKRWERARAKRRKCFKEVEASLGEQGLKKEELWEVCGIDDDPEPAAQFYSRL